MTAAHLDSSPLIPRRILAPLIVFIFHLGALVGFFAFCPTTVFAASSSIRVPGGGQVLVRSGSLFRDFDKGTLELGDKVQIIYNGQYISADSAVINEKTQEMVLRGNVVIASQQAYVEGESATLNYKENTGVFNGAFVKSGQVVFEGTTIRKTGEKTYEAENGYYTACDTCPPAWSFSGTKIEAELGGYAAITKPLLRVGNIPVFWFPYLVVPLKSERQTGFLVPKLEFTAGTLGVGIPFFWAISRSQDATFTWKTYAKRGFKGHVNYRYMLDENSEGELTAALIRDKTFADEQSNLGQEIGLKKNRWFLTYGHKYELPYDFTQKTKLNIASDLRYPRDFPNEMEGQGDPALENRLSLTRNTQLTHSSFEIDYYINQLKANALDSNRDAIHRWPEVRYSIRDTPILGSSALFRFNSNYVNFARDDFAFDDVVVDAQGKKTIDTTRSNNSQPGSNPGVFDPAQDLIRAGQRLDLQPEISYPMQVGRYLELLPILQLRHTQYSFNLSPPTSTGQSTFDPTPYRQYVRGEASVRTRFYTLFGGEAESPTASTTSSWRDYESEQANMPILTPPPRPNRYRHEIMPEIVFAGVPYLQQTGSQFFGEASEVPVFLNSQPINDNDFQTPRGVQFDYNDRFLNRNTVSLVMNNRLVRKSYSTGTPTYSQVASWKLGQTYDIDEANKQNQASYPWSNIYSLLDVRLDDFITNTEVRYFPYHRVANTTARARVINGQTYFGANFIQAFQITPILVDDKLPRTDEVGFEFGFNTRYFKFAGLIAFNPKGINLADYDVKSYGTELLIKPPGNCWGIGFTVKQLLGDAIAYDLNFDYNFGGAAL